MIEVLGLSRFFGSIRAVDDVTFTVPSGQVCGFLGPNGAGKSTTMKILAGFLQASKGDAKLGEKSINDDPLAVKKMLGYLPESCPLYGEMTVVEFLNFIADVRCLTSSEKQQGLERVRDMCKLEGVWQQPIDTLSKGFRQRVGFAQALIHDPPILILDEPTDGLDPNQKHDVREIIRAMGATKTILLSTHILEEVEAVCQRAIIIAKGKLVADDSPQGLIHNADHHNMIYLEFSDHESSLKAKTHLANLSEIKNIEEEKESVLKITPKGGKDLSAGVALNAQNQGWQFQSLRLVPGKLDEVFRKLTI